MNINYCYILAGGESSRMGKDKLFLKVDGKYLLENTIEICKKHFQKVIIVAKEKEKFQVFDCEILLDSETAQGPMAGIISALWHCPEENCFVTAADFRDLSSNVINSLLNAHRGEQYLGLSESRHIQPLCGIYAISSLYNFVRSAMKKKYSIQQTVGGLNKRMIQVNASPWRNINRPEDI